MNTCNIKSDLRNMNIRLKKCPISDSLKLEDTRKLVSSLRRVHNVAFLIHFCYFSAFSILFCKFFKKGKIDYPDVIFLVTNENMGLCLYMNMLLHNKAKLPT